MRPFQLLSAVAVFISLKTVEAAGYWACDGVVIPNDNALSAARSAFGFAAGFYHGYPSIVRTTPPQEGLGELRLFPVSLTNESWSGGAVDYYVMTNQDRSYIKVYSNVGLGTMCGYYET
ncbi:putative candidate secreted effector protein [Blumeria hordei DH14]|uniref:Putative candidate secreted effector protein n=1 Tax=Blumeria graminis f. sp. hordei (strain DH14) TaxID=546991 RepID=N1JIF3_BLUG1|nr:putative candidate secreted effector protein [Blumeria hordei DH14]